MNIRGYLNSIKNKHSQHLNKKNELLNESMYYAEAAKNFKDKKQNYQELMLGKLDFMNS